MKNEATPAPQALPMYLVTGFLGVGKTTLLKQLIARYRDRRLVYLVNEFSVHDVDGAIVAEGCDDVVTIPGGSIFCTCLVTEFIGQLNRILERFDGVEGVVIEASGMANPKVIETMLRETGLQASYELRHIVSMVDPGSFAKLRNMLPNIVAQVEAADHILINKCDLYDEATLAAMEADLRSINPSGALIRTTQGVLPIDLLATTREERLLEGEYAKCRDPNYDSFAVLPDPTLTVAALRALIETHREGLYRLKGAVQLAEGAHRVDVSDAELKIEALGEQLLSPGKAGLAVIMPGSAPEASKAALRGLGTLLEA